MRRIREFWKVLFIANITLVFAACTINDMERGMFNGVLAFIAGIALLVIK